MRSFSKLRFSIQQRRPTRHSQVQTLTCCLSRRGHLTFLPSWKWGKEWVQALLFACRGQLDHDVVSCRLCLDLGQLSLAKPTITHSLQTARESLVCKCFLGGQQGFLNDQLGLQACECRRSLGCVYEGPSIDRSLGSTYVCRCHGMM